MATDYWPQEEGCIFDAGAYILPCRPDDVISENGFVKVGTTVAGRISVTVSAAFGDAIGVALKAATAAGVPERIPVLFYGAMKCLGGQSGTNLTVGKFVMNCITTTITDQLGTTFVATGLKVFGGASYILGLLLQGGAGTDEVVVLVGKCI